MHVLWCGKTRRLAKVNEVMTVFRYENAHMIIEFMSKAEVAFDGTGRVHLDVERLGNLHVLNARRQ